MKNRLFLNDKEQVTQPREMLLEDERQNLAQCSSAKAVLESIWSLEEEKKMTGLNLLWQWWSARNKANARENRSSKNEVCRMIQYRLNDCARPAEKDAVHRVPRQIKWLPPPEHVTKTNFDGAFSADQKTGGWGFAARDETGNVRVAGAGRSYYSRTPCLFMLRLKPEWLHFDAPSG